MCVSVCLSCCPGPHIVSVCSDGAVFFLDPDKGPTARKGGGGGASGEGQVIVAQLTVLSSFSGTAQMAVSGRSSSSVVAGGANKKTSPAADYHQKRVKFAIAGAGH